MGVPNKVATDSMSVDYSQVNLNPVNPVDRAFSNLKNTINYYYYLLIYKKTSRLGECWFVFLFIVSQPPSVQLVKASRTWLNLFSVAVEILPMPTCTCDQMFFTLHAL